MNFRGYQTYKDQSVNTMTRGEMLLLLYDEMIKRLTRASLALEKKDYVMFTQSVKRTREIVEYLIQTLDFQYPLSRDLKRMYDFFLYELSRLDASRNPQLIPGLQSLIRELRDAFSQAAHETNL